MQKGNKDIDINRLWEQMKSGSEESLSQIFTYFYSDLYQYGLKIYNLPYLVKDSIQDVFVRIWDKRKTIGDVQNPKAYLISSIRRKILTNKDITHTELSDEVLKDAGVKNFSFSISEFIEMEEISQKLRSSLIEALNSLPPKQRELIFLRFNYNLKYKEIAQIMEVNEQTVRNMMQRAMTNLRSKIDSDLKEGIDYLNDLLITLFLFFRK